MSAGGAKIGGVAELMVREMTAAEAEVWLERSVRGFAAAQVAAGSWPPDEAQDRSVANLAELLPGGVATPGMVFLRACLVDGTPVGAVWVALAHPRGVPDCAYLYEIEVDAAFRGAGHGRALLAAVEDVVRARGVGALELNVFGRNARAIGLYSSSGYLVVTQQMRKPLR